jgi:hypothetical protein
MEPRIWSMEGMVAEWSESGMDVSPGWWAARQARHGRSRA